MKVLRRLSKKSSQGFTFIELIIAIVVISIAVSVLMLVLGRLINATVMPSLLNTSVGLAEHELERVSGMRFSAVANAGPTAFTGSFSAYNYQIIVTPVPVALANDPAMTLYKQVEVIVTHNTAGASSLRTVISRKS